MRFSLRFSRSYFPGFVFTLALFPMLPAFAVATTVVNPLCPDNTALFNPGGGGLQPEGPAIDIAFEELRGEGGDEDEGGAAGGRLFASDSNQATHAHNGQNNSSRIVIVDPLTGRVTPFITGLPTGDHPTEQLAFKAGWIYWSQGSTTNSGVVGRDNGGGQNQQDIPCPA